MVQKYEQVIKSLVPTPREQQIIQAVKIGIASDNNKSPWDNDKWYKKFTPRNTDGLSFTKVPKNKLLMVVSEDFSTIYNRQERGNFVMQGSIIVKLDDTVVYCLDAFSWYGGSGQAHVYPVTGIHTIDLNNVSGILKEIKDVKL